MGKKSTATGKKGETTASCYLQNKGYQLLEKNFCCLYGEIDLILIDKENTLVFAEVKTRTYPFKVDQPAESISPNKKKHLENAALTYLSKKNLPDVNCRIDFVGVTLDRKGNVLEIEHIENIGG